MILLTTTNSQLTLDLAPSIMPSPMSPFTTILVLFGALLVTETSTNSVHQKWNISLEEYSSELKLKPQMNRSSLISNLTRNFEIELIHQLEIADNDHSGWYFKSVPVDEPAVMRNFTIAKNTILEAFTLACNGTNTSSFEVSPLISAKKNMYRSDYEIYFVVIQKDVDKPWQCRACIQNLFLNSNPPIPFTKLIPLECHAPGGPEFTAFSSLNKIKIKNPDET